jgi:hypothetical protein
MHGQPIDAERVSAPGCLTSESGFWARGTVMYAGHRHLCAVPSSMRGAVIYVTYVGNDIYAFPTSSVVPGPAECRSPEPITTCLSDQITARAYGFRAPARVSCGPSLRPRNDASRLGERRHLCHLCGKTTSMAVHGLPARTRAGPVIRSTNRHCETSPMTSMAKPSSMRARRPAPQSRAPDRR